MSKIDLDDFLSQLDPKLRKKITSGNTIEISKQKTPSISLNNALKGGFGYGRQVLIWGNKSAGKSSFCLQMIADAQKDGKLFINNQEIKPVLHQQAQPDGVALGLPQGTLWVDSDSNPSVLSVDTTIQITGGTLTGDQALTSRLRNITVSTSDPTGGNNGDIWLKYTV